MAPLNSRTRHIAARIAELEQRHDEQPRSSTLAELTDNGSTYRHADLTVTRESGETEADFYQRTCSTLGVDFVIGLVAVKPGDVPRKADGRIDVPACSDELLRELLDAKRRSEAHAKTPRRLSANTPTVNSTG